MTFKLPEMPQGGWASAARWTAIITLGVCVSAVIGSKIIDDMLGMPLSDADVIRAVVLSIALSIPVVGFLTIKIQQLHLANEKLHKFAVTDSLTGWLNRAAFAERVEAELRAAAARSEAVSSALLVIDIDHFKIINDTFGHQKGDEALRSVTRAMGQGLREHDICGRLGGEEFGVFLYDVDAQSAWQLAERCRETVDEMLFIADGQYHAISVSIGVCMVTDTRNFAMLYRDADKKLYRAKATGRNRVVTALDGYDGPEPGHKVPSEVQRLVA